jgi:hypothetical protein
MSQPVSGAPAPAPTQTRYAAVEIGMPSRIFAWVATSIALLVGFYLAIRNFNGVGTAAVFAVAFLFGVVALSGTLPAAVKVGDVEVMLRDAKQQGRAEGVVQATAATAEVATLQKAPEEVVAQLPVPDLVKPAVKSALEVVQQAATSEPADWQAAVAAGTIPTPVA